MRIFFQGNRDSIVISDDISVTVLDIDGGEVVLAIDAPEGVEINGQEPVRSEDELEEWNPVQPR